jgi:hypothetical protein
VRLAEVRRRAEALALSEEGLTLWRELAAADRETYLPDLAAAVNNLAGRMDTRRTERRS